MIIAVPAEQLADLARAEAERHPLRTPERRAAAALYVALTDTQTIDAARRALAGFAAPQVQAEALELLHRLAAEISQRGPDAPVTELGQTAPERTPTT